MKSSLRDLELSNHFPAVCSERPAVLVQLSHMAVVRFGWEDLAGFLNFMLTKASVCRDLSCVCVTLMSLCDLDFLSAWCLSPWGMSLEGQVDAVVGIMGQLSGSVTGPPVSHMEVVASNKPSSHDLRPRQDQWRDLQWSQ